jgi:pyruvate/2-oxoglutarate dehydrogenase complex dihydrolipoamide dehydrogenase (E3) component
MERLKVDILLQIEATVEKVKALNPYAIILATGGQPFIPDMEGYDLPNVCHYTDVKRERKVFDLNQIAVLGSGMVCHSTVRKLTEQGNKVTFIEISTKSGKKISPPTRARLLKKMEAWNVNIITKHTVDKIVLDGLMMVDNVSGKQTKVEVEQVVIAMGIKAYNPLEVLFRKHFDDVFVIGDAAGYISLVDATRGGFETANVLESLVTKKGISDKINYRRRREGKS